VKTSVWPAAEKVAGLTASDTVRLGFSTLSVAPVEVDVEKSVDDTYSAVILSAPTPRLEVVHEATPLPLTDTPVAPPQLAIAVPLEKNTMLPPGVPSEELTVALKVTDELSNE